MVKSKPRILDRRSRNLHRFESKQNSYNLHLLKLASFSPSSEEKLQPNPTSSSKLEKSPSTPSSLNLRKRRLLFKKRAKPTLFKSQSQSPSLSCSSPSSSSSPPPKIDYSSVVASTSSSEVFLLPPLPPPPSPDFLRRTVSDTSCLKFSQKSPSRPVSRNLLGQLTPLPTSSSSPSNVLRRTISQPVSVQCSSSTKEEKEKWNTKEEVVEAEKLSGEWIVVKFNCDCGNFSHYLVNAAAKKSFKLIENV